MKLQRNDIVIQIPAKGPKRLLRVKNPKGSKVICTPADREVLASASTIDVPLSEIVVNLGDKPQMSQRVLGVRPWPFKRTEITKAGDVHWFRTSKTEERDALHRGLEAANSWMNKHKLHPKQVSFEIYPKSGTYAGMYYHKPREDVNIIELMPESFAQAPETFNSESRSATLWAKYICLHEMGHGVWFTLFPKRLRAEWLELYADLHTLAQANNKLLHKLGKKIRKHNGTLGEFKASVSEEEAELTDLAVSWIADFRKIKSREFSDLLENNRPKLIEKLWPERYELLDVDTAVPITEYANKDVSELFAEAFAHYACGIKIPKKYRRAVETALKVCAGRQATGTPTSNGSD